MLLKNSRVYWTWGPMDHKEFVDLLIISGPGSAVGTGYYFHCELRIRVCKQLHLLGTAYKQDPKRLDAVPLGLCRNSKVEP